MRAVMLLAFVAGLTLHAASSAASGAPSSRGSIGNVAAAPARAETVTPTAQPSTGASPRPLPTPGPIVPGGNPVGKVGIAAMVVAAVAGLWIYRVIRKGL